MIFTDNTSVVGISVVGKQIYFPHSINKTSVSILISHQKLCYNSLSYLSYSIWLLWIRVGYLWGAYLG